MRIQISWLLRILLLKDLTQNPVDDTPIKVVSKTAPDFELRRSQSELGESNEDAEKNLLLRHVYVVLGIRLNFCHILE